MARTHINTFEILHFCSFLCFKNNIIIKSKSHLREEDGWQGLVHDGAAQEQGQQPHAVRAVQHQVVRGGQQSREPRADDLEV